MIFAFFFHGIQTFNHFLEFIKLIIYKTTLNYAEENNHQDIVELLKKGINHISVQISSQKNQEVISTSQSLPQPNNSEAENEPQTQQSVEKVENEKKTLRIQIITNSKPFSMMPKIKYWKKKKNEEKEINEKKEEFKKEYSSKDIEFEKILSYKNDEYDAFLNEKGSETQALLDIFQNLQNKFDATLN